VSGQEGGGERSQTPPPAFSPAREGAPRPHDNADTPHPLPRRAAPPANRHWRLWAVPQSWNRELLAGSGDELEPLGSPTPQVVTPVRRRWVTGPGRAARPHHDWLLPRDITRLGEKCERERESEPQRRELQAEQGPPLGTRSPPPAPGPAASPADPPSLLSVPPSVRPERSGTEAAGE
jgi:hypothetical protein